MGDRAENINTDLTILDLREGNERNMTTIIDITTPITPDMIVYKNKPEKKPVIRATRTLQQGAAESQIILTATAEPTSTPHHTWSPKAMG